MAQTIVIRLERPVTGVDLTGSYTAFGTNWEAIEEAAQKLDILSPLDFVSETPEEYAEMMKDVKEVEKELGELDIEEVKKSPEMKQLLADLGNDPAVMKLFQEAKSPDELLAQVFPDESPGEEWFEPVEGAEFLRQLDAHVKKHPAKFQEADKLRKEFQSIAKILDAAQKQGVGFYFAVQG